MSAFLVDDGHIDYLVDAVRRYNNIRYAYIPAANGPGLDSVRIDTMDDTELGRALLGANLTSMMARYSGSLTPEEQGAVESYTYRRWRGPVSAVQTVKAVDCFDYQSCEYEDWESSLAHSVVQQIKSWAINELPGYDKAEWGLSRVAATVEG